MNDIGTDFVKIFQKNPYIATPQSKLQIDSDTLSLCEGIGEMPNIPAAPAITNAIANAVGARVYDLPAHCERVYTAIKNRLAGGN